MLDIKAGRDALDPGLKGRAFAQGGHMLPGRDESVLGNIIRRGGLRAHTAQQDPDRRTMAAHKVSKRRLVTPDGEGDKRPV